MTTNTDSIVGTTTVTDDGKGARTSRCNAHPSFVE
jgi:hypothetical protein